MNIFTKLKNALSKTKKILDASDQEQINTSIQINEEFYISFQEKLIRADVGFDLSEKITHILQASIKDKELDQEAINNKTKEAIKLVINQKNPSQLTLSSSILFLIVGVNGSGKTTSIGKLAHKLKVAGKKVLIVAGDTFRAAGAEQATLWGEKVDVDVYSPENIKKPDAVVYGAIEKAKKENYDSVLIDTAGRLQAQTNLMEELGKVDAVIEKNKADYSVEKLIVLDATIGQNAMIQAKEFSKTVPLTGIILSKLDSSSKGGVIFNIINELSLPVKYVGIGEQLEDIVEFDFNQYLDSFLSK